MYTTGRDSKDSYLKTKLPIKTGKIGLKSDPQH